ncbi:MAG: bifunctional aspartate kinase/homoserine dehydrogenase I [Gemmatimonadales bacterium]|nr:bifunctional aspartate kinase/homoserine dehydrogenase I [Gemmatimonadales bacterium]
MPRPARGRPAAPHVHKFGGASMADARAIRHAAAVLGEAGDGPAVVVVSAMAGVTDALLSIGDLAARGETAAALEHSAALRARHVETAKGLLAAGPRRAEMLASVAEAFGELDGLVRSLRFVRELTPRTSDVVVSRGERLSALLLALHVAEAGRAARFVDATEVVHCDDHFGQASPDYARTDRAAQRALRPLLAKGIVPVVPGFLGLAPTGDVATLGRGGSDLTAALLARALGAAGVSLWKDVPGFLTADPRVVPDARVIPALHTREAAELAYYGAKVLHPRALTPLAGKRIPLRVRPFADPSAPGSEVSDRVSADRLPVKAISSAGGQALVTVAGNGMLGVPGIAARTFAALQARRISVSLISQASSEHSICFSVPEARAAEARTALAAEFRDEIARREIDGVEVRHGMAALAVVGLGMAGTPGVAAGVFSALASADINIVAIAQGSSELNISVVVDGAQAAEAQRRVHAAFQLARIGGGTVARPGRTDVVLLGFGQIGRLLGQLVPTAGRGQAELRIVAAIDRSGLVFDPRGLSKSRLARLAAEKERGRSLAEAPGGLACTPAEAVARVGERALSRPILVDVTADETTPVLALGLEAGMDLVLANKRPLAGPAAGARALRLAAEAVGRRLKHETTVGAGLPVIDTFHKLLESGDRIERIEGCLSGTLGFLLWEIGRGRRFSEALRIAMAEGYTEPDPRDDLSGMDVGRKALILARLLGYGGELPASAVESLVPAKARALDRKAFLDRLEEFDAAWEQRAAQAAHEGRVLRYVATVTRSAIEVGLRAVDRQSPFAALKGADNTVVFTTKRYHTNPLVITGPGAGPAVTAAGVLNDILALAGA